MNANNLQKKLTEIEELKSNINFLTKLKNFINPEKVHGQVVSQTINEEISLLAYQKLNLVEEYEKMITKLPLPQKHLNKKAGMEGENYIPENPPITDIYSSLKKLKSKNPQQKRKNLGYGAGSLV